MDLARFTRLLGARNSTIAERKSFVDARRRLLDVAFSATVTPSALALTALSAAVAVLNGETRPIRATRIVGRHGRHFKRYSIKTPLAPRRLRILTEIIRRTHADQASHFLHVLLGDMSLVGPEALTPAEADTLETHDWVRFAVRPGLTDIYQLRKRMNIAFESRSVLERSYLAQRGVLKDLAILARTVPTLILGGKAPIQADSFVLQDIRVDNISMQDAIQQLAKCAGSTDNRHIAFVNPHCFNVALTDADYKQILQSVDMVLPDGIGVKVGGMMIGADVRENVNGTDLFPKLCELSAAKGYRLYLVGGSEGIAERVKDNVETAHPGLSVVGTHHGYLVPDSVEERALIDHINEVKPDFLLVGMGVPLQEKWIEAHIKELQVGATIGVGGLFDFYSGRIPRAPIWMREIGMEWFWRLAQEPRRMFRRYIVGNPRFLFNVWKWYIGQARTQLINRFDTIDLPANRFLVEAQFQFRRGLWFVAIDGSRKLKRIIDIVGASSGILVLSPILLTAAAAIKIEDGGPIFFTQSRVGRRGKIFQMYKFRSMRVDAEALKDQLWERNESEDGVIFKIRQDPRITRVGRIIRRFSIDEMPQLANVLKGDMSLVGPRPPVPSEVDRYTVSHRDRLEVVPGLTCLWQVSGRSLLSFNEQVSLDRSYIQHQSLIGDLRLILRTIPAVLSGHGAY